MVFNNRKLKIKEILKMGHGTARAGHFSCTEENRSIRIRHAPLKGWMITKPLSNQQRVLVEIRSIGLTARIPPCHGGGEGSIPS